MNPWWWSLPSRRAPGDKRPRWGWRTLGFLTFASLGVITSTLMGAYTYGTLAAVFIGFVAAFYCSIRGVLAALESGIFTRPPR